MTLKKETSFLFITTSVSVLQSIFRIVPDHTIKGFVSNYSKPAEFVNVRSAEVLFALVLSLFLLPARSVLLDSTDLIDVYRTKWQAGSEVLSNVGDLMWDCGKAAAADHLNCMDRSRGFGGHQFEGQPHLFPRPDWGVRNCFNCGQPGHLARECRVVRGVGLPVGFLGRGVQQRGWPYPGIRPLTLHPREAAFLLNRDDGQQGWQQQVASDFPDSRIPGCAGRESGNRNISFMHSRLVDRPRDRHSGWADYDAHLNLPLPSRASDESHRKIPSRRSVGRRNDVARKDTEDNDARFRAVANGCSSAGEEGGKGYYTEEKASAWHAESDGLFEIKPEMDRAIGPDSALDRSRSQVRVLADNDDPTRALYGNKAETRSQEKDSGTNVRPSQAVKGDKGDSDLENGEFVSEGNMQWAASGNLPVGSDKVNPKSNYDGDALVLQQAPTNPSILNSRAITERKAATKNEHSPEVKDVRVKVAINDEGDVWSWSDNSSSLRTDFTAKATTVNPCLERRADGKGREGAELFSAGNEMCEFRNGGIGQVASQINKSSAGPVYGSADCNLDGEVNFRGDFSGEPSASSDIFKRNTDCIASEGDFVSSEANLNMQCHPLSSTPPAFKPRESQRPLSALVSSVPARDPNISSGWRGRHSIDWNNCHKPSERAETVRFDSSGFPESLRNDRTNSLARRSGMPELTGQQFQPEHMTLNDEIKEWSSAEQKVCPHVDLVAGARFQQSCTACQAEGDVNLVNGSERVNTEPLVCEEQYNIDARVEKLMLNFPLVQGREQDSVAGMSP